MLLLLLQLLLMRMLWRGALLRAVHLVFILCVNGGTLYTAGIEQYPTWHVLDNKLCVSLCNRSIYT